MRNNIVTCVLCIMLAAWISEQVPAQPSPSVTDNLVVRLETVGSTTATLSGGNVVTWHDQAALGGAQDATDGGIASRQPAYLTNATPIGKDALDFSGVAQYLEIGSSTALATNTVTWFVVFKYDTFINSAPMLVMTETNAIGSYSWCSFQNGANIYNSSRDSSSGGAVNSSLAFSDTNNWHIITGVWNGGAATPDFGAGTVQGWVDDAAMSVASGATEVPTSHDWTRIGSSGPQYHLDGKIAALLVYDRVLTPSEIDNIELYLTGTYLQDPGSPPEVNSVEQLNPVQTSQDILDFAVTFSKDVTLEASDIQVDGTLAAGASVAVNGSGTDWTVEVAPADPDADGTLGITVLTTVEDIFLQALAAPASSGLYQVDGTFPLVFYDAEAGASPADPATVGWAEDDVSGTDDQTTAVLDGGSVDAWRVFDAGTGSRAAYQVALGSEDLDDAEGWTMTARSRTLYATGIFQSTFFLEDGTDRWVMHFDNPDPDAVPPADTGERVYSDGITLPLNISGDRGASTVSYASPWLPSDPAAFSDDTPVYHTYQMLYDPATSSTRFLVDGEGWGSVPYTSTGNVAARRAFFGSSTGGGIGDSTWNYVALHKGQQPVPWVNSAAFQALDPSVSTVTLDLTFNTEVSGVNVSDFDLITTGVAGASIVNLNLPSSTTAELIVDYGTGEGELSVRLVDDNSIVNAVGLAFSGRDLKNFVSGVLNTPGAPPEVSVIDLVDPQQTGADVLDFAVTFTDDVNFGESDVQVDGSLAAGTTVTVSGGPMAWSVSVELADPLAEGSLGITILTSVTNLATQNLVAEESSALYEVANRYPVIVYDATIDAAAQDPLLQGWTLDLPLATSTTVTSVVDGDGTEAWRVYDWSSTSRVSYISYLPSEYFGSSEGWHVRVRARSLATQGLGAVCYVNDGETFWNVTFRNEQPATPYPADTSEAAYSFASPNDPDGFFMQMDLAGTTGTVIQDYWQALVGNDLADDVPTYSDFLLHYDPAGSTSGTLTYYVNGEQVDVLDRADAWNSGVAPRIHFGSSTAGLGDNLWNYVSFTVGAPPVPASAGTWELFE